jgi:PHS family inorganic phosphate transporter-like MFS transporter
MLISGMGFFTDAYDLFVIDVVMALLKPIWHVGKVEEGLVESTALLAAAIGALLFGRVADMVGRKRIYGVEVLVLAAGAIACAFSPNIWWHIGFRFILGIGIGGDYPVSRHHHEYAGKAHRGMLVTLVFAMQAAGPIIGPLLAAVLLSTHLSHDIIWRILISFGACPPSPFMVHVATLKSHRLACDKDAGGKIHLAPVRRRSLTCDRLRAAATVCRW